MFFVLSSSTFPMFVACTCVWCKRVVQGFGAFLCLCSENRATTWLDLVVRSQNINNHKMASTGKRRVGIVGFGHLGEYLAKAILEDPKVSAECELGFVWNRSSGALTHTHTHLRPAYPPTHPAPTPHATRTRTHTRTHSTRARTSTPWHITRPHMHAIRQQSWVLTCICARRQNHKLQCESLTKHHPS